MFIRWFKDLTIKDIPSVGGKNASLGEMYAKLSSKGVPVPNGFALTADAYREFLKNNDLDKKIKLEIKNLNVRDVVALKRAGEKVRKLILQTEFPKEIKEEIKIAYKKLQQSSKLKKGKEFSVAVRSSATAEDLPNASFAGQQETYLNVKGEQEILIACKKCIASLFTDRAISYREDKGFDHMAVALSVCVQEMVRSDLASSGVMFTLDTESGYTGVVLINSAYGLGEYVVKGRVVPDQFYVYKTGLKQGYNAIFSKKLGSKDARLIYSKTGTKQAKVSTKERNTFSLTDKEVLQLAKWGLVIEQHYGHPMDIEWAKDGKTGKLFIVQARGETVKSQQQINVAETYKLNLLDLQTNKLKVLATGSAVGQKIGQGKVRIVENPSQMKNFKKGDVLVTRITDPDWEPIMRFASAIITEQGGKTSHAAIVSRELGVPCIVGVKNARKILKPNAEITVSCAEGEEGKIYVGNLPFTIEKTEYKDLPTTRTKIMMNLGDPGNAFALAGIPCDGVGLAREEFLFTNFVKIHPMALVNYNNLKDLSAKKKITELTVGYKDKIQYAVDKLAEGMAFIAGAFDGKDVILRLSDFKTNEYATLIGGSSYEPKEENPMIGWRGASRYYDEKYKAGFKIECLAIKKVREEWGMKNVIVMVPFCRTVEEGKKVLATMKEYGLERGKDGLKVYVMAEIPSNVILADEFCQIFDGFSIGSNDLTQLTLGVDRDSALVSHVYDENNKAVKILIRDLIKIAHKNKRKVGICGQAPSDYPEFAEFLTSEGIDSISLNPDTVLKTKKRIALAEKKSNKFLTKFNNMATFTKTFLALGFMAITLVLGGYSCEGLQNLANKEVIDNAKQNFAVQLEQMKADLKNEAVKQVGGTKSEFTTQSFIDLTIAYPTGWNINQTLDEITFKSKDGKEWFKISSLSHENKIPSSETENDNFFDLPIKKFAYTDKTTNEELKVVEIYPKGYEGKKQVEIIGTSARFEEIFQSIDEFKIK